MITQSFIRPLTLCVFRHKQFILVEKQTGLSEGEEKYSLVGGELKHGEYSWESLRRMIKVQLDEDIKDLIFMGPTEHIAHRSGNIEHEIIFLFKAAFVNPEAYNKTHFKAENGRNFIWMPVKFFESHKDQFYPMSVLESIFLQDDPVFASH